MDMFDTFGYPTWIWLACAVVYLLHVYTSRQHGLFRDLNIDGPRPYPFVGGIPQMLRKGMLQNDWDNVRRYGKCYGCFMGNLPTLVVTDTAMIKHVFIKDFHRFQYRGQAFNVSKFWRNGLNLAIGDHWKFLRVTLSPSFSTRKIQNMVACMEQCICTTMIKTLNSKLDAADSIVDMTSLYHRLALDMTCATILGVRLHSQKDNENQLVTQCRKLFELSIEKNPCVILTCLFPHLKHMFHFLDMDFINKDVTTYLQKAMAPIIADRKACLDDNQTNLLALMLRSISETDKPTNGSNGLSYSGDKKNRRSLTDEEIVVNAIAFMLGGYDTTSATLMFASYLLAVNPICQERAVAEIETQLADNLESVHTIATPYLDAVVCETLRLYPVGTMTNREALTDTEVCGIKVPKGVPITVPIYVLHRMPEYWYQPNEFIPDRWLPEHKHKIDPYAYMPFGIGPRGCIGKRMALVAVKLVLLRLLKEFKLKPAPDLQIPIQLKDTFFLCPKDNIRLIISRRNSTCA